jgi:branched-chain amino acid transport system substrate-binding protein
VLTVLGDIRRARMLMCSGSDTLAPVTARSSDGLYFRTAPGPSLQGLALAQLVMADAHRRVGILRRDDFFGDEVGAALVHGLRKSRAHVVADLAYSPALGNVDAKVRAVVRRKPQAIVVIGFDDDAAQVVTTLIEHGAGPGAVAIYGPDTMQSLGFAAAVDPADLSKVAGIKGTAPSPAPAGGSTTIPAALSARGVDPVFSAHVYDCTILTALAAVKAKSDDPDAMKRAFARNLHGKTDCETFATCTAFLKGGHSIHWRGASSRFAHFHGFEPGDGMYDTWSYDTTGRLVAGDPTTQISVP